MKLTFFANTFRTIVNTQLWIAICAWVSSAATPLLLEHRILAWPYGLLIFSVVLCTYSLYYIKNANYPMAPYIASISAVLSAIIYFTLQFPKPWLVLVLTTLSILYMLPQGKKTAVKLLYRWGLLTLIWTLFLVYFPLNRYPTNLLAGCWFAYRFFFIGNLCFIFLLKDDKDYFTRRQLSFAQRILMMGQAIAILSFAYAHSALLSLTLGLPYLLLLFLYKKQSSLVGIYYYSLGIDGLLILESIFVQSLFIYGLGEFSTF